MKKAPFILLAVLLIAGCTAKVSTPPSDGDPLVEAKVNEVLSGMTLEEKVGQMVQLTISVLENSSRDGLDPAKLDEIIGKYKVGSILNVMGDKAHSRAETAEMIKVIQNKSMEEIGIPCIYGLDMIHGATYLSDGTFFPQEINLAATFNRSYASAMGEAIAYESRAAMVPWVFSPVMDLGRDPRWPRHWESWGEDPFLSSEMAVAEMNAIQGEDRDHVDLEHAAVSIKHYMAYGVPLSGKDRTPAYVPENDLREKYFRPFKECFEAGALTAMVNSASINGVPTHANEELLTGWVKKDLGWDGMFVTDWADIDNLYARDHVAADKKDALRIGINAGIDMIMDPYDPKCCEDIKTLVEEGKIPMSRIDDAVRRILRLKVRLGLFDNPTWEPSLERFGSEEFRKASYEAALESEVLLKNEGGILPIGEGKKILVTGPNANSLRAQNGGWSYTWQGSADDFAPEYNTFYEALRERFGIGKVFLMEGVKYTGPSWQDEDDSEISRAVTAAGFVDIIIACVGENSYCESPGNMDDLNLSSKQKALVKALAATGKPIVLVLNEGRPRIIGDIEPLASAVVDVMLPSNYGGDALAALLSGDENFSGRLPFTYSKHVHALHTYDYKVSEHREMMEGMYNYDAVMDVQWPFGHGLSYSTFKYSDLKVLSGSEFKAGDELRFSVTVRNTSTRPGKEAVLLYSSDLVASIIPDVKRLRAFEKISLDFGETKTVEFTVPASELAFVGSDGRWRLEEGDFRISCGGLSVPIHCTETKVWDTPNIK
ncbi:MAG: glycoside hydrolase family 3 C-terminal domain-containing protein [Bacteroidales bacterium]|nr:glycoside hydrolase family 3 C-terminal domain-containing protein [Bacteroidales bacterium]MBQ2549923.1 glycoside hydrolase family 3 C-terminal domain-containing protein [Bacteroidales bacterium]